MRVNIKSSALNLKWSIVSRLGNNLESFREMHIVNITNSEEYFHKTLSDAGFQLSPDNQTLQNPIETGDIKQKADEIQFLRKELRKYTSQNVSITFIEYSFPLLYIIQYRKLLFSC